MKIFVIGGTGFISSGLVRQLLDRGHSVTTFTRGRSRAWYEGGPNLTVRHGDRRNAESLRGALGSESFDVVYDMVAYTADDSQTAVDVFRGRTGRFIHCSTISVYMVSDHVYCPVTEDQDDRPLMAHWPRNPFGMDYGIDKRGCEDVLWAAHDEKSFPVTILRPTYASGPRDPTRRDWFWIERMFDGGPLLVPGTGDFAFQQVYVDDIVQTFVSVLSHPVSVGRAYNVASEDICSLNDYLRRLAALIDRDPEMVHMDQRVFDELPLSMSREGDVFPFNTRRTAVFSLERSRSELDYRSTPFEEWMPQTIKWYQSQGRHSIGYEYREQEISLARAWKTCAAEAAEAFTERIT